MCGNCTVYTVNHTVCSAVYSCGNCKLYPTMYSVQCCVQLRKLYTLYSTVNRAQWQLYSVHFTVYRAQCGVCGGNYRCCYLISVNCLVFSNGNCYCTVVLTIQYPVCSGINSDFTVCNVGTALFVPFVRNHRATGRLLLFDLI